MTKRETIDAFIRGDIDRRAFIGRLTTLGVSTGAALAYATTFGQSALAAPSSSASGFVAQGQDDGDYGVPIDLGPLEEGLALLLAALDELISIFDSFGDFLPDDFGDGIFDGLETIQEQLETQFDALGSLFGAGSVPARRQFGQRSQLAAVQPGDAEGFLQSVSLAFDGLSARFAAVVPGTEEAVARQTMMNVAMVSGRHTGFVNWAAGNNPFPSAFQEPAVTES